MTSVNQSETKENLILVHSYPTNSILLDGLIEFLEEYFNLHFIDLPGFTRAVPPLKNISIDNFARHLEEKISNLSINNYILGGISFGYLVISKVKTDSRCKAILAMEPFLGIRSLYMGAFKRFILGTIARASSSLGFARGIWNGSRFQNRMIRRGYPKERVDTMIREIDPRTYFATAGILVRYNETLNWPDKPCILIVNPHDKTINAEDVTEVFQKHFEQLLVIETTIDHYPKEMTKQYFSDRISEKQIEAIVSFINQNRPNNQLSTTNEQIHN